MVKIIKNILVLSSMFMIIYSCNSNVCNENMASTLNIYFYSKFSKIDSVPGYITVYGIHSTIDHDSLYKRAQTSFFQVPLSINDTISNFYIAVDSINNNIWYPVWKDTLHVTYKVKNSFISYECGFRSEFTLNSIYFSNLKPDSTSISQRFVSFKNEKNYKIYLHSSLHK